jgi:hypothetical protein
MCQVKLFRPEQSLVSIPVGKAIYCEDCQTVSNSLRGRCDSCGSKRVLRVSALIDGPPYGPDSGPAASGCAVPTRVLEIARAA